MKPEPCSVCGGTDMNLIDGFYYCVECGTQDVNAQETVIEHTVLGDGTFAHTATKKYTTILKDAIEMSGEWHKWHTFNFILVGLVDELIALGASENFRSKVLWIWTRYMKEFQNKDKMGTILENNEEKNKSILFDFEEENTDNASSNDGETNDKFQTAEEKVEANNKSLDKSRNSIKIVTKGLLLAIIYTALNLDYSDIQLSHLCRFIREGRISIANCLKFVPKEMNLKSIPHWKSFDNCKKEYTPKYIRLIAMSLFRTLDLGTPVLPDLRKIVENYVKELCLPNEFKNFAFSLMHEVTYDFLVVDYKSVKKNLIRIPDFEGVTMAYLLVGLKMSFGLDDDYEIKLSDAVDKINEKGNLLKSHKLGLYSDCTDRLFSFRDWCNYLQFRKTILCKYFLPIAQQHNRDIDDEVFMEQLEEREKGKIKLSDEVTMDILNKISVKDEGSVIPKSEFAPTLTPMTNYTEVILQYIQDPDVKLLLSEDFTQYSLKYACVDLKLLSEEVNIVKGVSEENKMENTPTTGTLVSKQYDPTIVYVKNCENKNWLFTNPPTVDHLTKTDDIESSSDKYSDPGYDSNMETALPVENELDSMNDQEGNQPSRELETIQEELEDVSIFDDNFEDLETDEKPIIDDSDNEGRNLEFHNHIESDLQDSIGSFTTSPATFNPETFDREGTIKELILIACKTYKIPIPREYNLKESRKRSSKIVHIGADVSEAKRRKVNRNKPGETRKEMNEIIDAYYRNLQTDFLNQVSKHVKSVINDFNVTPVKHEEIVNNSEDINYSNVEENKSATTVGNEDKTNDFSVEEVYSDIEYGLEDLLPKLNPNFDEKTHDIKQLYVKYSEKFEFEDDFDDAVLDEILDKKIEECKRNESTICTNDVSVVSKESESDSDDEFPLTVIEDEMKFMKAKLLKRNLKLNPLIDKSNEIKEFKYWTRHYKSATMRKTRDVKLKFDLELQENCPKSFNFVIYECAAILDCTAFSLYKYMQNIEQMLI